MNAMKHIEAAFLVAVCAAGIVSYLATSPQAAARAGTAAAPRMAIVTVVGKRLSAAEKSQSLRDEADDVLASTRP